MKKTKSIIAVASLTLLLTACSDLEEIGNKLTGKDTEDVSTEEVSNESKNTTDTTDKAESSNSEKDAGIKENSEYGNESVISTKSLNINESTGSLKLNISGIKYSTIELNEYGERMFEKADGKISVITMKMKAQNTSDKVVTWYPDQATIVTDTGQQVRSTILMGGQVGGEFLGKVYFEDEVAWVLKHDEAVKKVTLYVDEPFDENYDNVGEKLKIDIDLK